MLHTDNHCDEKASLEMIRERGRQVDGVKGSYYNSVSLCADMVLSMSAHKDTSSQIGPLTFSYPL